MKSIRQEADITRRGWKSNCRIVKHGKWTCWEWAVYGTQTKQSSIVRSAGRMARKAHELFRGPLVNHCCHKCDNKLCVRPTHLYDGTRSQNSKDAWARHPDREARRSLASSTAKKMWRNPKYRAVKSKEASLQMKRLAKTPEYRERMALIWYDVRYIKARIKAPSTNRRVNSRRLRKLWRTSAWRRKMETLRSTDGRFTKGSHSAKT